MYGILEALGWSLFYTMMASLSHVHLTVAGIVQNVLILSFFFADGLWKAVSALAGNAIGRVRSELVPRIVHSAFFLMTAFAFCLGAFLWGMRSIISDWFLSGLPEEEQTLIYPALLFGLANAVLYKYLEGIRLSIRRSTDGCCRYKIFNGLRSSIRLDIYGATDLFSCLSGARFY